MRALFIVVINIRLFRFLVNDTLFNDFKSGLLSYRSAFHVYVSLCEFNYCGSRWRTLFLNLFKFDLQIQLIDNIIDLKIQAINLYMPLMLITPQMLSVAFFSLYRRVADEAPVGV